MYRGLLPMLVTIFSSVGVYYLWSVVLGQNDTAGTVLGVITAILVSAFFARMKKR